MNIFVSNVLNIILNYLCRKLLKIPKNILDEGPYYHLLVDMVYLD